MKQSLIEVLTEIEEKRKQESKLLLDEILADYEKENNQESETWSEADYELNEYLNGDGDIVHLYNYYNLINNG